MTLTIQDLGALGELLGSVAVLATLVYLTLQTRQNTAAIGAQLDAARIGAVLNIVLTSATSGELNEALIEDRNDDRSVNDMRRGAWWSAQLNMAQWNWAQTRRGLLATSDQPGWEFAINSWFRNFGSFERWWSNAKSAYPPEFVEFVEEQRSKAA